ncbi:hypothetical protein IWQ55_000789 [Labrenzia sp. EL_208]|nr:hypothetical protein [Labrenzia sp. EL_132]MBG6227591.1 hypothetical protein [Labrenzia sp. EL_208]
MGGDDAIDKNPGFPAANGIAFFGDDPLDQRDTFEEIVPILDECSKPLWGRYQHIVADFYFGLVEPVKADWCACRPVMREFFRHDFYHRNRQD